MGERNKVTLVVTGIALLAIVLGVVWAQTPRTSKAAISSIKLGMEPHDIDVLYPEALVRKVDSVTYVTGSKIDATVSVQYQDGVAAKIVGSRLEIGERVLSKGTPRSEILSRLGTPTWKGASRGVGETDYSLVRYDQYQLTVRCGKSGTVDWFELIDKDNRISELTRE